MKRSLLILLTFATSTLSAAEPFPENLKQGAFVIGCQAWTFNRFTAFEVIEKTAGTGAKVIEFFPGQKLAPDQKDVKFDHNASKEVWEKVQAKLKQHDIAPVA